MNDTPANDEPTSVSIEKRAELLLSHYDDSFQQIVSNWKTRNRLFVFILILLALMAVDTAKPGSLSSLVNGYVANTLSGEDTDPPQFDLTAIGSAAWFLLLCLVIQYYQRSIYVDRLYKYVARLEGELSDLLGKDLITREGKSYYTRNGVVVPDEGKDERLDKRPLILRMIGPLYTTYFPIGLTVMVAVRPFCEWYALGLHLSSDCSDWWPTIAYFLFDVFVSLVLIAYNLMYMTWAHARRQTVATGKTDRV